MYSFKPFFLIFTFLFSSSFQFSQRNPEALACAFITNERGVTNNRTLIFDELSKLMKIDSFGKYKRNKKASELGCKDEDKLCVLRHYKFYLAFENSNDESYVTEKYFSGNLSFLFIHSVVCHFKIHKFSTKTQLWLVEVFQ
jgi:hypothetical protein